MGRNLKSFIFDQIRADGIFYFIWDFKGCMAHCKNQKRLWDACNDPKSRELTAIYVDALYAAGDIK